MALLFTDQLDMVGKRPREIYWRELQDAIEDLDQRLTDESGPSALIISSLSGSDKLSDYPKGITSFEVMESVSTGYPTMNGIVETIYIDEFRNIQHFFEYPETDEVGDTYYRQWRPSIKGWTNWIKLITSNDLQEHSEDKTLHLREEDRPRLEGHRHVQIVASREWNIKHPLKKFPSVTIVDSGGIVLIGDVKYLSDGHVLVAFTSPITGIAYLN